MRLNDALSNQRLELCCLKRRIRRMNSFALLTHKLSDQSLTHKRSDEDKEIVKPQQSSTVKFCHEIINQVRYWSTPLIVNIPRDVYDWEWLRVTCLNRLNFTGKSGTCPEILISCYRPQS